MQLRRTTHDKEALKRQGDYRQCSPSHDIIASTTQDAVSSQVQMSPAGECDSASKALSLKQKVLKPSRSVESIHAPTSPRMPIPRSATGTLRRPSTDSAASLGGVAAATTAHRRRDKASSVDDVTVMRPEKGALGQQPRLPPSPGSSSLPSTSSLSLPSTTSVNHKVRRPAPAPPKRRKPPPVPVGTSNSGATITAIATSASTPSLSQFTKI